jgi:hypothetical protein
MLQANLAMATNMRVGGEQRGRVLGSTTVVEPAHEQVGHRRTTSSGVSKSQEFETPCRLAACADMRLRCGMRRAAASDEVAARVRPRAVLAGFAAENALFQQPMP